jgi:soluble epoxide hydrolase/lipid-phosphate phosphatase
MVQLEEHEFTYSNGEKKTFFLAAGPKEGPLIIFVHGLEQHIPD